MSAVISADKVCLDVPIYLQRENNASGWSGLLLGAAFQVPQRRLVRLLDEVCFDATDGDRVAVLGRNGAGKSTLLRMLNRVYQPTSGNLRVEGSCQALLNMSLGFNGEATVRENIFLRGVAMGLSASFLRDHVKPILDFSDLHEKVHHRLRTLSSGQRMRLGFAISTSVQHDIMLMDEWVGAGDADFMRKAKERMRSRVGGSKIVVLASHSVGLLRDICNKAIVLERGRVVYAGDITSGLKFYHELLAALRAQAIHVETEQGDGGQLVYGCLESLALDGARLRVRGWVSGSEGVVPQGLALQANGRNFPLMDVKRGKRQDVARHFGLNDQRCGFDGWVEVPGLKAVGDLDELQMLGGESSESAHTPLRIAPAVVAALKSASRHV